MQKSYAIAEIRNLLAKVEQEYELTRNTDVDEAANNIFDDLETIFKLYLTAEGYSFNDGKKDELVVANEANFKMSEDIVAVRDELDYAQKACITYEQQIKKLKENKSTVPKQFIEEHNKTVAYYRDVVKALIDKI